jgi:hypothetical protein
MKKKQHPARMNHSTAGTMQLLEFVLASEESLSDHLFLTLLMKGGVV